MKSDEILTALDGVGKKWTRQVKAEERHASARSRRAAMYTYSRVTLREICWEHMPEAWAQASDNGRLPTHWRQIFYVMRNIVDAHPHADRPLLDATFKAILEDYLWHEPGWDVLRGARGVFKEPHRAKGDNGLAMSTMNVRNYLGTGIPDGVLELIPNRYPTAGATNRIAAVLICEKEGFDEQLTAEQIPERFDLALMSTKGISAKAARDLAERLDAPCFTLHDLDKNGFVMASGFPFATDLGLRMENVEEWGLRSESQVHKNPDRAYENLIRNGATDEEADFISKGERVELNMLTSPQFIEFVEGKLDEHSVEKVVPDDETLARAWGRAYEVRTINRLIIHRRKRTGDTPNLNAEVPAAPDDLADQIRAAFEDDDTQSWDEALWTIAGGTDADLEEES